MNFVGRQDHKFHHVPFPRGLPHPTCTKPCTCAARRNFVARKEDCNNTWINKYGVYIRDYGSADSQSAGVLSSQDCWTVPNPIKCA